MQLCLQQERQALPQCGTKAREKRWVSWADNCFLHPAGVAVGYFSTFYFSANLLIKLDLLACLLWPYQPLFVPHSAAKPLAMVSGVRPAAALFQSYVLRRTRTQEHFGPAGSDEEGVLWSFSRAPAVPAEWLQPARVGGTEPGRRSQRGQPRTR